MITHGMLLPLSMTPMHGLRKSRRLFLTLHHCGEKWCAMARGRTPTTEAPKREFDKETVRLTVSLPKKSLIRVSAIADQMGVSAAWVIRKAVDEYVNRDVPL